MTTVARLWVSVSLFAIIAGVASVAAAAPDAAAQSGGAGTDGNATSQAGVLSEIVVTAERREENLEKVPLAVSALTGQALEAQGVVGFADLSARVPSLRFGQNTGGEYVITMRGLGSQNTTIGGDSPVAYNVNGVYLEQSTAVDPEYYDVQRVEVLRGPQGTLYGRNSAGGSINVVTDEPQKVFAASADALVGNYDAHTLRGWVTGPLVSGGDVEVDARLTGVWAYHGPYDTNLSTAPTATHNQDMENFWLLRGQVKFLIGSNADLLIFANLNHDVNPVGTNTAWWETPFRFTNPPLGIAPGSPCDFSTAAAFNPRVFCHDSPDSGEHDTQLFSATFNWRLSGATFTSVTGYETGQVSTTNDADGSNLPIGIQFLWKTDNRQLSQEFRLASQDDHSPLSWLVGFIYFYSDDNTGFGTEDTGYNDVFPTPGRTDEYTLVDGGTAYTASWAPFGQADFDFANTQIGIPLTVTLGLRYTNDHKYGANQLSDDYPAIPLDVIKQGPWSDTWAELTGKLAAQYKLTERTMAYVSASRGYVAGGETAGVGSPYNPETLWSYESGLKTRLLDDRLQLNVAAYYESIQDLQVYIQNAIASGLSNVPGTTPVYGVETEINYDPIDDLHLNAAITLTDAHYGPYQSKDQRFPGQPGPGCNATTLLCNFEGNPLNQTPPYTVDLGAEYVFHTSLGAIIPRVDMFFSGRVNFLPENDTLVQTPYHMTNLSLTWKSPNHRYRIEAFVKNLENVNVISNDALKSSTFDEGRFTPDSLTYYAPRTFGVRVAVNIGP